MRKTLSVGNTRAETEDCKKIFFHLQPKMGVIRQGLYRNRTNIRPYYISTPPGQILHVLIFVRINIRRPPPPRTRPDGQKIGIEQKKQYCLKKYD